MALGRINEALFESERALELDPISAVMNNHLGLALYVARDYDSAISQLDHTLLLDPEFVLAYWYQGMTFASWDLFRRLKRRIEKHGRSIAKTSLSARTLHISMRVSGDREQARSELEALETLSKSKLFRRSAWQ